MKVIHVPKPPAHAFQKSRRVSDLLASQLKQFQHVHSKYDLAIDPELVRDVHTEGGAARYIAALRSLSQAAPQRLAQAGVVAIDRKRPRKALPAEASPAASSVISIAAAADASSPEQDARPAKGKRATANKGPGSKSRSKKKSAAKRGKRS